MINSRVTPTRSTSTCRGTATACARSWKRISSDSAARSSSHRRRAPSCTTSRSRPSASRVASGPSLNRRCASERARSDTDPVPASEPDASSAARSPAEARQPSETEWPPPADTPSPDAAAGAARRVVAGRPSGFGCGLLAVALRRRVGAGRQRRGPRSVGACSPPSTNPSPRRRRSRRMPSKPRTTSTTMPSSRRYAMPCTTTRHWVLARSRARSSTRTEVEERRGHFRRRR